MGIEVFIEIEEEAIAAPHGVGTLRKKSQINLMADEDIPWPVTHAMVIKNKLSRYLSLD